MDIKELQAFKMILVEGSFSKAAQKLHYAQSTISTLKLALIIEEFRKQKPRVTCNIVLGNTATLSHLLNEKQLDFMIAGEITDGSYQTVFEALYRETLVLIVSKKYKAFFKEKINLTCIYDHPLVIAEEKCLTFIKLDEQIAHFSEKPFYYAVGQLSNVQEKQIYLIRIQSKAISFT